MTKKETKVVERNNRRSKDRYETRYKGSMKKQRVALGLSPQEVADNVGVHVTTYRLWERMAVKPSDENVAKLKSVLNLK